jgi:hypothetical protein
MVMELRSSTGGSACIASACFVPPRPYGAALVRATGDWKGTNDMELRSSMRGSADLANACAAPPAPTVRRPYGRSATGRA